MRKRRYNHSDEKLQQMEETRLAILSAAFKEFSTQGYENASMAEIAKSAKTAKGTLYNYFESKQKLYAEIAWKIMQQLEKTVCDQVNENNTGLERVKKIGRELYRFFRNNRFYYEVFSFLNTNIMEIIGNDSRFSRDPIAEITVASIEQGKKDGSISCDVHPVKFLAFASSTIWGMLMYMHERGDSIIAKTGLSEEEMVDYCFEGIEKALL
ncbi:MAG: TetR/AcrR family transcriptional regulator [Spirochaetia bacterium]|nr:TetR/AcrR family transcriptional regulator [Spirochaetia bacterium]